MAVTQGIYDRLSERRVDCDKLALVPNGANTEHIHFNAEGRAAVRAQLGLQDKFVVMYAGIHGIAQGLETLLQAASLLQDSPDIHFVFVGEGPRKAALAQLLADMNLQNVIMLPEVPSSKMPSYLSAADCTIVPLREEPLFRGALPSKMFEFVGRRAPHRAERRRRSPTGAGTGKRRYRLPPRRPRWHGPCHPNPS